MPFDSSGISSVRVARDGTDLLIVWDSADPTVIHQVWVDGRRVWSGVGTMAVIPWPGEPVSIEVGTVDDGEAHVNLSAELPPGPADRVTLTWTGGTYLDEDIAGFRVYRGSGSGGSSGVDDTYGGFGIGLFGLNDDPGFAGPADILVGDIPAYVGVILDGFGVGGFGGGGFGRSASYYRWRSGHLAPGIWRFTVRPYDAAGNEGVAVATYTAEIAGAPQPPAADSGGIRLRVAAYDPTPRVATLAWSASPA